VAVAEDQQVAGGGKGTGDHAVRAAPNLIHGFALRDRARRDRPARILSPDLRSRTSLERSVIPFRKVVVDLKTIAESGNPARFEGPSSRAREDERERMAGKLTSDRPRLVAPEVGERHVGPAGVAPQPSPFRFAMPDEPDLGKARGT